MTDTDRTLLEKAARAADILLPAGELSVACTDEGWGPWNPLIDDGDALRLAVKLHLAIEHNHPLDNKAWVMAVNVRADIWMTEEVEDETRRSDATRRAIVRAAASLGEQHDQ